MYKTKSVEQDPRSPPLKMPYQEIKPTDLLKTAGIPDQRVSFVP
jgi:hypothetical protein